MRKLKLIAFAIVVCAVSALNVKVMLNSEHAEDMSMTALAALEGTPGESGESGESGEGGEGGQPWYIICHSGGQGSSACSIAAGVEIVGSGTSKGCSVSCNSGYYACCTMRCVCHKI